MTSKIFTKSIWPTRTGSRSLGLQTFSLSLAPSLVNDFFPTAELVEKDRSKGIGIPTCEAPTQNPSKHHAKAFRCTDFFLPGFSDLPCQWSWAIKLKLGGILKFNPTLRGCFKIMETHFSLIFRQQTCLRTGLVATIGICRPKFQRQRKSKKNCPPRKKQRCSWKKRKLSKSSQLRFRNDKTLLSQCVQYAVVWLPGFGSFREPPSCPSGIVCWYTSNVTNWLAWKKQDICTEVLMILFKPRSNKL